MTGNNISSSLAKTLNQAVLKILCEVSEKLTYWDSSALNAKEKDVQLFKGFGRKSMNSEQAKRLDEQKTFDRYLPHRYLINANPVPTNLLCHLKLCDEDKSYVRFEDTEEKI